MNRSLAMRTMLDSMASKSMKKRWNRMKMKEIPKRISSFKKKKNRLPKNSKERNTKKRRLKTKEMTLSMISSIISERSRCRIKKKMWQYLKKRTICKSKSKDSNQRSSQRRIGCFKVKSKLPKDLSTVFLSKISSSKQESGLVNRLLHNTMKTWRRW